MSEVSSPYLVPLLAFSVPGKPVSTNAMYHKSQRGVYLTFAARNWKASVKDEAWLALRASRYTSLPNGLHVKCTIYGSRCDADNALKLVLDGLKDGINVDDKHFTHIEAIKGVLPGMCGVVIEVSAPLTDGTAEDERAAARGIAAGLKRIRVTHG